ncbi:hypothetical protein [Shewanella surugensis]|uniref:Lipoprotein n=1 Tax=Shewanella surugensis TaxID=212020 RepID=A0ABT0LJN3_9GAMM|nr:hypothetical protein [Shewanella surugensis]MCL1127921.1 hypothetical protein [Shewanella surugensis]
MTFRPITIVILSILFLSGCVNTVPKDLESISTNIKIEHDSFQNQTWITTPLYLSRQGITDTFPVKISFRSLYKNDMREFIQLYVTSTNVDWGFYHSANGEDGYSFGFSDIDREVSTVGNMVTTEEHFGLIFPIDYLEKMSKKDWKIKVYGKRYGGVFIVPENMSKAFMNKLSCYESDKCS